MSNIQRVGDLEVSQDLEFVRKEWTVQRIAWVVMALLVLAAVLGLFGGGPLSSATASTEQQSLTIRYPRFARFLAPTTLQVQVGDQFVGENEVRIKLGSQYLDNIQIQHITPQPDRVESGQEDTVYVFTPLAPGESLNITFHYQTQKIGRLAGHVALGDEPLLRFSQFTYP